jgi:hypothetical protein
MYAEASGSGFECETENRGPPRTAVLLENLDLLIMSVQAGVTRIKSSSQLLRLLVLGSVAHYLALGGYEARSLATAGRKWN